MLQCSMPTVYSKVVVRRIMQSFGRIVILTLFPLLRYALLLPSSVEAVAPPGAVVVFERGEGGYYCHKIPYLFRTSSNTLIALAEGRGKDGRTTCDDFSVLLEIVCGC